MHAKHFPTSEGTDADEHEDDGEDHDQVQDENPHGDHPAGHNNVGRRKRVEGDAAADADEVTYDDVRGNDEEDDAADKDADDEHDAGNVIFRMTLCSALRGAESAVGNGFLF